MLHFLQKDLPIGHYSGYKTRVTAKYFFELTNVEDLSHLSEAYIFAKEQNIPFLIIGGGTNLLFSGDFFPGVVIKNNLSGWKYDNNTRILHAYSNERIWDIAKLLEEKESNNLWHRFIGLPGSIGGAVYGNAGCFGLETESNFLRARIYDMMTGEIIVLEKNDLGFGYRHSFLKDSPQVFLIDATFDLGQKQEKYHSDIDNIDFRENKQPKGNSCGSFWKNPSRDISAGALIESVGLKGYRIGGASWSPLHANFLISDGETCRPQDLLALVEFTREKVEKDTGYKLQNEVRIILCESLPKNNET